MRVRTESRRTAIVEAAASVFFEMGYEGASMNEVTRRAGGSKTTLYNYFASKESLFVAVVECHAMAYIAKAVHALQSQVINLPSLRSTLLSFAENVLTVLTNDAEALAVYRMVVGESGRSDVGRIFYESGPQQCIDVLSQVMLTAMQLGLLREAEPPLRASQLLALITTECERRVFQIAPEPLTLHRIGTMAENAVEMFLNGARP
ncbi:TetR/AcrR family transcriptional regulator [Pseudomonas syringae]|uniref:TetR/AcrR family transcriptional regulator n=1 Tax=Pseudomonas syringae pv. papulans TaxID=83963 RepID=A0A0P9WWC4_PSESX|nr:TetR/AcrR family transcriptional regulator [Pseudomonas syringae]KPY24526.1 Transcriptional regulator, TetR family protein [Pseudomonas syringae pv. papulans]KWS38884.1 TetR family transcriptional regulator [Pseudomonas syringae pv. papulans]MDH4606853.1 TetR/AcrR family transcriptional regulator [Pseudomonas syringae pv. papulans]MDH4623163.1 TetR/AcrR family transcriptional regulator [Pseudomonas syringae pv. papulans]POP83761.1 TetR/AcrR family transcriptional regulator [Pseudomonas syri